MRIYARTHPSSYLPKENGENGVLKPLTHKKPRWLPNILSPPQPQPTASKGCCGFPPKCIPFFFFSSRDFYSHSSSSSRLSYLARSWHSLQLPFFLILLFFPFVLSHVLSIRFPLTSSSYACFLDEKNPRFLTFRLKWAFLSQTIHGLH